jgi:hypothetical protein
MPCAWSLVAPESISRSKCQKLLVQYSALLAVQPAISDDEKAEILVRRSTLNACLGNTNESIEDAMLAAELCPSMAVVRDRVHTPSAPLTFGHPAWQAFYRVGVGHFLQHRFGVAANFFLKVRVCFAPCRVCAVMTVCRCQGLEKNSHSPHLRHALKLAMARIRD